MSATAGSDLAGKGLPQAAARRPIPPFTEEHEEFRKAVRRFVEKELRPHAPEWEDARWFPNEVFHRLAELGYLGLKFPEEYGGEGGGYIADAVFTEELSRCASGGLAAGIGAHTSIALPPVWKFGTEDQKQRYLVPGIRGREDRGAGDHRARRRLRRGGDQDARHAASRAVTSSTAPRCSSPTACAPTSSSRR